MGDDQVRLCAVVPTFNNPRTIRKTVERLKAHLDEVLVVDDGSHDQGRAEVEALASEGLARALRRPTNGGKGAAVKDGLRLARQRGFTHALQVDADGQHDLDDLPRFVEACRREPRALVLGSPRFDASAPRARLWGRKITIFWVHVETLGSAIEDPMCGFRVYPLDAALAVGPTGDRMDFDIEVAVRMVWAGTPVINLPTRVRYVPASEGGVSHFRMFGDNARISWLHTRLTLGMFGWVLSGRRARLIGPS